MTSAFVFAADKGYELPLAVAMSSLVETTPQVSVVVLDGGLLADAKRSIEAHLHGRADVRWIEVNNELLAGTQLSGPARLPVTTNYRLLLPELAPDLSRAVYLDADTVIVSSMAGLLDTELSEDWLAAVPDAGAPLAAGPSGPDWRELGIPAGATYFNAGVVVMPLPLWRERGLGAQTLAVLRERKPRWGDQDALNVVCQGHIRQLPRRYNLQLNDATGRSLNWALWPEDVSAALNDPALVHYNGHVKPWQHGCQHPLQHLWWEALERTPWRGWQIPKQNRFVGLIKKGVAGLRKELQR